MNPDILVVGAGISGLTAAYDLQQRGFVVEVLEAAPRAGGVIATVRRDGALYERGPNSTLDTSPQIGELLAELGIGDERANAGSVASIRYIVRDGVLQPLPTSPGKFFTTAAFSLKAKLRLLREPFIGRGAAGSEESIAAFVRRRLGGEFLDYAIDPFVAGIYAGDPERISVAAAFPRLLALEQKYGGLIKGQILGARERRKSGEVAKNSAGSFSFRDGMQTLTDALAGKLARISTGVEVRGIGRRDDGSFTVSGRQGGQPLERHAQAVIVAAPAPAAAAMIDALAPEAARALAAIGYAPIAIAASAYRRADVTHSLAGFGFLVPKVEHRAILGGLFSSSMFEGRAPPGAVLLTTFAGGRRNPDMMQLSDEALGAALRAEHADLLGVRALPLWEELVRWPQAIPQYDLGHLDLMRTVEAAEAALPGLWFCANYRGGVSVGDRIVRGRETGELVSRYLAGAPAPAA